MRIRGPSPFRSLGRSGQFVPLATMILFTSMLLMVAGMNIYRISKAKLQVQNMADAAALAVASLEAKAVNTVVDRNEWMNHMYGDGYHQNDKSLPNISVANGKSRPSAIAKPYANLVATINRAQQMFITAYDNFIGADPSGKSKTASNGAGVAALADILSEIDGLSDPRVKAIWVYNSDSTKPNMSTVTDIAKKMQPTMDIGGKLGVGMNALTFETADISLKVDGKNMQTLASLAGMPSGKVGWMRPVWDDPDNSMKVQVSKNAGTQQHWGVGVVIVKEVPLFLFGVKTVKATSVAYVVDAAGEAGHSIHDTTPRFRPTYFARLAYNPS